MKCYCNIDSLSIYTADFFSFKISISFQRAGVRDEKGIPIIKDCFSSPLTARL